MLLSPAAAATLWEPDVELDVLRGVGDARALLSSARPCDACSMPLVPLRFDALLEADCLLRDVTLGWCARCERFCFEPFDPLAAVSPADGALSFAGDVTFGVGSAVEVSLATRSAPRLVARGVRGQRDERGRFGFDAAAERDAYARLERARGGAVLGLVPSVYHAARRHPTELKIEPTTYCNLRCTFCPNPELETRRHMKAAEFDAIWGKTDPRHLTKVGFTGLGESLMNPDLWHMIRTVSGASVRTSLVSNGTLLSRFRDELAASNLDDIAVSIETTDPERFAAQRVGGDLARILEQIRDLQQTLVRAGSKTRVHVLSVMLDEGDSGARGVLELCASLGIDAPRFYPLYDRYLDAARGEGRGAVEGLQRTFDAIDRDTKEVFGVAARVPREVMLARRASGDARYENLMCREHLRLLGFRADGTLMPCAEAIFQPTWPAPNIADLASVVDAWRSPFSRAHRFALSVAAPPAPCRGCNAMEMPLSLASDVEAGRRRLAIIGTP